MSDPTKRRAMTGDEVLAVRALFHDYGTKLLKCKDLSDLLRLDMATLRTLALTLKLEADA